MHNPLNIFLIKRNERWLFMAAMLIFICLNTLSIYGNWGMYTKPLIHGGSWSVFTPRFEMSGYDCWSWLTVSEGRVFFETVRHPLYLSVLYPLWWLNHWLMTWTGLNWAVLMIGTIIIISATYSAIFLFRTFREVLGVPAKDSYLLVALLFSFGHVMIPAMVPDHFIISMMLLTMTIYICGKKMVQCQSLATGSTLAMLFFTSGIALSNGLKTILAALFTNRKRFFRAKYIIIGIIAPLATLLCIQRCQYYTVELPEKANLKKMTPAKLRAKAKHHEQIKKTEMKFAGKGIFAMMDFATPRKDIIEENFFGETIVLHSDNALGDIVKHRPVVVRYQHWWAYAIETFFFIAFITGAWAGRKSKVMQMLLCWFAVDVLLNVVLGFAINELYLMASGWLFSVPIAMSFLANGLHRRAHLVVWCLTLLLTLFLWGHNLYIIINHLYG